MPLSEVIEIVRTREHRIRGVRFRDEKARSPSPFEGTIEDLLGNHHLARSQKSGTPAYSAVEYKEGALRGKRGVEVINAVALDFDHLTSEQAEAVCRKAQSAGWAHVCCSSFSHLSAGPEDHCFRMLIVPSRPILPDEYEAVWVATDKSLGREADKQARDCSRLWYVASCPPERMGSSFLRFHNGRPLDVDRALSHSAIPVKKRRKKLEGSVKEGGRTAVLMSLGGTMRRRGAGRDEIQAALQVSNASRCLPPLSDEKVRGVVDGLLKYDPSLPTLVFNRTDAGNAERFSIRAEGRFSYVHPWKVWLRYIGGKWEADDSNAVVREALATLRDLMSQAEKIPDDDYRGVMVQWALESEASARISALLKLGASMNFVSPAQLDRDRWALNVANGTVNLETGELRGAVATDWVTRQCPVHFDATAECPQWLEFLSDVMGGDTELVEFLQRAVGYSLTGETCEQVMFLLYGTGANGKSTFLETLRAMLDDYSAVTDFTTFLKRDSEGARNDLARLVGTRLVSATEAQQGKPLDEPLVKSLTGGDTITCRFLFKEFFDYEPQFKIWLAANHKPRVRGRDHGIWRRIVLIPFTVTIDEKKRDRQLGAKLKKELPGILRWALDGCRAWREKGLNPPGAVVEATTGYRDEMDLYQEFFEEQTVEGDLLWVSAFRRLRPFPRLVRESWDPDEIQKDALRRAPRPRIRGGPKKRVSGLERTRAQGSRRTDSAKRQV